MHRGGYRQYIKHGQRGRPPVANPKSHRLTVCLDAVAYAELQALASVNICPWSGTSVAPGRQAGKMLSDRLRILAARRAAVSVNLES